MFRFMFVAHETCSGQAVSDEFVASALRIAESMLTDENVRKLLFEADETFGAGNPLDSITKLNIIRRKVPGHALHECLSLLLDYFRGGAITAEQFGTRNLDGKLSGSAGKGILDIMVFKLEIISCMTGQLLDKYDWPDTVKTDPRSIQHVRTYIIAIRSVTTSLCERFCLSAACFGCA